MAKTPFDKFSAKSNSSKKEGYKQAKRSIKKEIADGMAKTKARKDAESAKKAEAKAARKDSVKNAASNNYAKRGVPIPEAPFIPRNPSAPAPLKPVPAQAASKPIFAQASSKHISTQASSKPLSAQASSKPLSAQASSKPGSAKNSSRPVSGKTSPRPLSAKTAPATPASAMPVAGTPHTAAPVGKAPASKPQKSGARTGGQAAPAQMPLNKYIAHGGLASRRDAATLVKEGAVKVNGAVVTEPGYKVTETDEIRVNGKKVVPSKNLVYVLLNKPKDVITTNSDPEGRKTVMDLVGGATDERIFPVGRLDRNTTGVLLLTNDGELAQKLAHPAFEIKKIYEIRLDRELTKKDFDTILGGVALEDGLISPDALAYADAKDKSVIGIEIHSGKNRIVRRIFEHLDYKVKNLDRVLYAGLTKKNVDRGRWRFLNEKEVRILKYLNNSKVTR